MSLPVNLREPINHGTAAAREQARAETPSETKIEKVVDLKSSPKRETINKNAALSRAQDITKPTKEAHKTIALQKEAKTQPEAKEASSASQSAAKRETLDAGNSKTRQAANPTDKKSLIRPQIFAQPAAVPTKTQPKATPIFSVSCSIGAKFSTFSSCSSSSISSCYFPSTAKRTLEKRYGPNKTTDKG